MATDNQNGNHRELHIDKVLSSQPELGPSVPEGGYGWVILTASLFFQALIPSLSLGFGVFTLFSRLENNASMTDPTLWDSKLVYVSLIFTAIWTITDPWSRLLCTVSTWPRLVATAGTCLTCAGLLIMWMGINNGYNTGLFLLAGLLAGVGASVVLSQTDVIVSQYFHLKLESVTLILNAVSAFGFVITPVVLGHNIVKLGILQVITWYQAIILQGILISIAFKKPQYLKTHRSKYKLIKGISDVDDEEDIFAKNTTELQNPRHSNSINTNTEATIEASPSSIGNDVNIPTEEHLTSEGWAKFDDDEDNAHTLKIPPDLHKSLADEFKDLDKIEQFEDNYIEIPRPLFSETQINNNTSYSYDVPTETGDPVVFMPNTKKEGNWKKDLEMFKQPTFYKSLLFIITTKFSVFTFWTLFPTYLYLKVDSLKVNQATMIVGCVGIGSLLFTTLSTWIKSNSNTRAIFLWIFCWMGAIGYIVLSDAEKQSALIFGAIDITLSITALQILGIPLMKINLRGETSQVHTIICTLTGISLMLFLTINMSYKNCFRFMALLQFLTGSLWCSNFIYKKIKKHILNRS